MARILNGSHSFTCTPRVRPLTELTIPAFAFPAKAGPHLLTLEGRRARQINVPSGKVCIKVSIPLEAPLYRGI